MFSKIQQLKSWYSSLLWGGFHGQDTRMRYRGSVGWVGHQWQGYLDIRRNPIKDALLLRNKVTRLVREPLALASSGMAVR